MKRTNFLAFIIGLLILTMGFNNCTREVKVTSTIPISNDSGGTTVGTPMVEFKIAPFTSPSSQSAVTICIDQVILTSAETNNAPVIVPIGKSEKSLSPSGTNLGSLRIPAGSYSEITIPLSAQCDSQKSLQIVNGQGTFKSFETLSLRFSGQNLVENKLTSIALNIQSLVNAMDQVTSDASLVTVAENQIGTWNASSMNEWFTMSTQGAPSPRLNHTGVWTGSKMIIWGGWYQYDFSAGRDTGGIYDPANDSWTATSTDGAPLARQLHTALWTGSKMLIWGGSDSGDTSLNSGGLFDPETNSWSTMSVTGAPAARRYHTAVWTGTKMLVWGGADNNGNKLNDGAIYDLATDSWSPINTVGAPTARAFHTAVWTGSKMIIWGGCISTNVDCPGDADALDTGGLYDPATNSWQTMSLTNVPTNRYRHSAIWTGSEMIVWGGESHLPNNHYYLGEGARYNPTTDSWTSISNTNAASMRTYHTALWTGSKMIIWGGVDNDGFLDSGALYDPLTDQWTPMTSQDPPLARRWHASVWTGSEMIIWGGFNNRFDPVNVSGGGRYVP